MFQAPFVNIIDPTATRLRAVDDGFIFLGKEDTDPTVPTNQIPVYYKDENGVTQQLSQPIQLNATGVPVLSKSSGTIINPIFYADVVSIVIQYKSGKTCYSDKNYPALSEYFNHLFSAAGYSYQGQWVPSITIPSKPPRDSKYALWEPSEGTIVVPIVSSSFVTGQTFADDVAAGKFKRVILGDLKEAYADTIYTKSISSIDAGYLLDLSNSKVIDIINESLNITLYRRVDLDDQSKSGTSEISYGTLLLFDKNGAAFADSKKSIGKRSRSEGLESGKNVHIYQWGSPYGGNDWCFIRTPENYNASGKPHPFVILNHGNGWIMNGSLETANFSGQTQFGVDPQNNGAYLDTSRPDYVKYSSPLIEKYLSEGFVVCGAQNDGQRYGAGSAAFGNREVQQNIKMFFDHMQENYNVESWCSMVAASNGSIGTLNATLILGRDKVRDISLLYPLINIFYAWNSTYRSGVATAYNINPPESFTSFLQQTVGHDVMIANTDVSPLSYNTDISTYANTDAYTLKQSTTPPTWEKTQTLINDTIPPVSNIPLDSVPMFRRSTFSWPRIRCYYSKGDTTTPPQYHWLAFEKLLFRGNHLHRGDEVTGDHGSWEHFNEDGIVGWSKL